jgi:vacuolar-type H+-ATPase subunit C/Vma6
MRPQWGDLVSRSRGLATHLLRRNDLAGLARTQDLPALSVALGRYGFPIEEGTRGSPAGLDLAVRREAATRLRTLARWSGGRSEILSIVFDDEDRRSLRAIFRAIVQHATPEERVTGLIPTPALPERALQELGRQSTLAAAISLLSIWKNPYAPPLREALTATEPDLLKLEVLLNRAFAARALHGARRAGKRSLLLEYVRETIDLENAFTAVVMAGETGARGGADLYLPGGRVVDRVLLDAAMGSGSPTLAAQRFATVFAGTALSRPFVEATVGAGDLERLILRARIADLRKKAFHAPLDAAPVLCYALQVRAQVLDLRHIIWGISLAAPGTMLEQKLVALA